MTHNFSHKCPGQISIFALHYGNCHCTKILHCDLVSCTVYWQLLIAKIFVFHVIAVLLILACFKWNTLYSHSTWQGNGVCNDLTRESDETKTCCQRNVLVIVLHNEYASEKSDYDDKHIYILCHCYLILENDYTLILSLLMSTSIIFIIIMVFFRDLLIKII